MDTQALTTSTTRVEIDPFALLARADLADSTRGKYTRALSRYLETGNDLGDTLALAGYADTISNTEKRFLSAVISKYADAKVDFIKAVPVNTVEGVAAKQEEIMQAESLKKVVKPPKQKGEKTHTWLSPVQVRALANEVGNGIVGARDRVAVGLLVAAGLRRLEAVSLTWDQVKEQPYGDKVRVVLAVAGKGAKDRTVPVSATLARDLETWSEYTGREGLVLRSLGRKKELGDSMSAVALFKLVRKYGSRIGVDKLAPHDMRRTFAKIGYYNGVDIGQISLLLGHESIETTQRYLGIEIDLTSTASDFIPW